MHAWATPLLTAVFSLWAGPPDGPVLPAPEHAITVYRYAAATAPCPLDWHTLGGVAAVASNHGQITADESTGPITLDDSGNTSSPILSEALDGQAGRARIDDSEQGALDGDRDFDRAVGPFQFIPATWAQWGLDGNGDGTLDPNNVWDASVSAAALLCDHDVSGDLDGALTAYFGTDEYLAWFHRRADELREPRTMSGALTVPGMAPSPSAVSKPPAYPDRIELSEPGVVAGDWDGDGIDSDVVLDTPQLGLAAGAVPIIGDWDGDGIDDLGSYSAGRFVLGSSSDGSSQPDRPPSEVTLGSATALAVTGDWDGNGRDTVGVFEYSETGGHFLLVDERGRPYGAPVDVAPALRPAADPTPAGPGAPEPPSPSSLQAVTVVPVAGDWDADGVDTPGVVVVADNEATVSTFDRRGQVIESIALGPADPLSIAALAVKRPLADGAPSELPDVEFWKEAVADDGTALRLWRVRGIAVDETLVGPLAALLAAAEADGVALDGWGWRSHDQQIALRQQNCPDAWTTPPAACTPPTAIPGTSRHETGSAIDFTADGSVLTASSPQFLWLQEHGADFGLFNLPSEPWHWSVDGS